MNMKRIVFAAVGILIMLVIIAFTLHSITHIDEINQKRRDKERGEAIASQMITTTVTTSVWDRIRQTGTETTSGEPEPDEISESGISGQESVTEAAPEENAGFPAEEDNTAVQQTLTETIVP